MTTPLSSLKIHLAHLKRSLARDDAGMVQQVLESLQYVPVTVSALKRSRAGVVVGRLMRASKQSDVKSACASLLRLWHDQSLKRIAAVNSRHAAVVEASAGDPNEHPYTRLLRRLRAPISINGIYDSVEWDYDESVSMEKGRRRRLKPGSKDAKGPVILWMSRDQRVRDNWALVHAQSQAMRKKTTLVVVFCLVPKFLQATARQYGFMLRGLRYVEQDLHALGISFRVLLGNPTEQLPRYARAVGASTIVADFSPLRVGLDWKRQVCQRVPKETAVVEVDAHNVVPAWVASDRQEVGARTFRPRVHSWLDGYLTAFPQLIKMTSAVDDSEILGKSWAAQRDGSMPVGKKNMEGAGGEAAGTGAGAGAGAADSGAATGGAAAAEGGSGDVAEGVFGRASSDFDGDAVPCVAQLDDEGRWIDWVQVAASLQIDWSVPEVSFARPGERAAEETLARYLSRPYLRYAESSRNPTKPDALSGLSPYIHFGQISAQRVLLELMRITETDIQGLFVKKASTSAQSFAEQVLVRREISDNFCLYNPQYDSLEGAAQWARQTLAEHTGDARGRVYSEEELERARTHDPLWNAAQSEMVHDGKMHGWCRMYWAKKILEWTKTPADALRIAQRLNDRYSIDGRDPNGFVGVGWAIMGVHDMGFKETAVTGKIRPMTLDGARRKFDVDKYVRMHPIRPSKPFSTDPPAEGAAATGGAGSKADATAGSGGAAAMET